MEFAGVQPIKRGEMDTVGLGTDRAISCIVRPKASSSIQLYMPQNMKGYELAEKGLT